MKKLLACIAFFISASGVGILLRRWAAQQRPIDSAESISARNDVEFDRLINELSPAEMADLAKPLQHRFPVQIKADPQLAQRLASSATC